MTAPRPIAKPDWISALVEQHQSMLIRYAHSLVGDADASRDIVQEAFLRLCREPREQVEAHAVPWLFRVCHNLASNRHRKERRMNANLDSVKHQVARGNATDTVDNNDQYLRVIELIDDLPEKQQQVVRLRFTSGMSYRQIGETMGLSESNVGFLLHTALMSLRRYFQTQSIASGGQS